MKKYSLILFAPLLCILLALGYLNQFPNSLASIIPHLVKTALKDKPYQLAFEQANVSHVGLDGLVSIRLHDVELKGDTGEPLTAIPNVMIEASVFDALIGRQAIERVTLEAPKLKLLRKSDGTLRFSSGRDETQLSSPVIVATENNTDSSLQSRSAAEEVKSLTEGDVKLAEEAEPRKATANEVHTKAPRALDQPLNRLIEQGLAYLPRSVMLRGAELTLIDETAKSHVRWSDVSLSLKNERHHWDGVGRATLQLPNSHALLTLKLKAENTGNADIGVEFNDVNLASLCAVRRDMCGEFSDLSMPLSGEVHLFANEAPLPNIAIQLEHYDVSLAHPRWFSAGGALSHYVIAGSYNANKEKAVLDKLTLGVGEGMLSVSGSFDDVASIPSVALQMEGTNIDISLLKGVWPAGFAVDARDWVTQNLPVGMVSTLKGKANIPSEQLASGTIANDAIFAEAQVEGAEVHYLPGYPHVHGVDAKAMFNAESMNVLISAGHTLEDSKVEEGEVRIPDFSVPGVPMEIDLLVDASAADVARFINPPRYSFAKALTLNPKTIQGRATGKIKLKFNTASIETEETNETLAPINSDTKTEEIGDVFYAIEAELHQLSQKKVRSKWDFDGVDASVQADATGVSLKGVGKIHGVASRFSVEDRIGKPTRYSFKGKVPKAKLSLFDLPDHDAISGWVDVDAKVSLPSKSRQISELTLGLTDAEIDMPAIGWFKPKGEQASLRFSADTDNARTLLKKLSLSSEHFSLSGEATLTDGLTLQSASLDTLRTGKHTMSVDVSHLNNIYDIRLRGDGVDLSALGQEVKEEDNTTGFSISTLPSIKIDADIASFILAEGVELRKINAQLDCAGLGGRCERVNISTLLPKGDGLVARIFRNEKNQRALRVVTDDGAGLAKLLGIHDDIEGGELDIRGVYHDDEKGAPLKGRLVMEDFTLRKAPILSKLLSLGSFTGMLDTLQGKGLVFDKLGASFSFASDLLKIEKSQLKGNTLGATQSGTIDIQKNILNLKGALFPSYFLNTLVSNVPLIGELITGGEGEGLIGIRYAIKGQADKPDVSVNPLSALTPGFMRGIFDAFEADDSNTAKQQEKLEVLDDALSPLPSQEVEIVPAK